LRLASDNALLDMPVVQFGIPSVFQAALMPRVMVTPRARWLVMTGATIDAATALNWGLADVVTTPDKLDAEIEKVLSEILECGAEAIAAQKVLLRKWEELPLTEAIDASIPIFGQSFLTGEPQHHMQKFIDRPRKPKV
jgi:enoyl-CoA hydratase/carnithine racemase